MDENTQVTLDFGLIEYNIKLNKFKDIPYFDSYISGRWPIPQNNTILLDHISVSAFHWLLDYIKGKTSEIPSEYVEDIKFFGISLNEEKEKKIVPYIGDINFCNHTCQAFQFITLIPYNEKKLIQHEINNCLKVTDSHILNNELLEKEFHQSFPTITKSQKKEHNKYEITIMRSGDIIKCEYILIVIPPISKGVWVSQLGLKIIKNISLEIGKQTIINYSNKWLKVLYDIYTKDSEKNHEGIFDLPYDEREELSRKGFILRIPVNFVKCILLSLQFHQVKIIVELNDNLELFNDASEEIIIDNVKSIDSIIYYENEARGYFSTNTYNDQITQYNILEQPIENSSKSAKLISYRMSLSNLNKIHNIKELIIKSDYEIESVELNLNGICLNVYYNIFLTETIPLKILGRKMPYGYYYISFSDNPMTDTFQNSVLYLSKKYDTFSIKIYFKSNENIDEKSVDIFYTSYNVLKYQGGMGILLFN